MELQLKRIRKLRGFTQEDMAKRLGVKKSRYGTWERGERVPPLPLACACADILDCTLDELAGRKVERTYTDSGQEIVNICYENMNDKGKETLVSVARSLERDGANRAVKNRAEAVDDSAALGA